MNPTKNIPQTLFNHFCHHLNSIKVVVKLQFPYKLSFLSVFWITSNSNQKYRLDVVSEVFNRDTERHHGY